MPTTKIGMQDKEERDKREMPPTIVAELSRNWPVSLLEPMALLFEDCIESNRKRGYVLRNWQFSQCAIEGQLVETIIAVFDRATTNRLKNKR